MPPRFLALGNLGLLILKSFVGSLQLGVRGVRIMHMYRILYSANTQKAAFDVDKAEVLKSVPSMTPSNSWPILLSNGAGMKKHQVLETTISAG